MKTEVRRALSVVRNQKGVALLLAISVVSIILYLAMEVMYETNVEYIVNSQSLNRLKAYYSAKAGVDISLLRVKVYNQAKKQLGKNAAMVPFLEQIWKFKLIWPLPTSEEMGMGTKDEYQKIKKESFLEANFDTQIDDESAKIDINDLISPSKVLRENAKRQLLNIYQERLKVDEGYQRKFANFNFQELLNNIADWMSNKRDSLNGGDKRAPYREYNSEALPPNRGFRTLSEMRLVALMDDELYSMIANKVTIYGARGINPNTASKDVLMSLDPGITSEIADKAIARRDDIQKGGPFKASKENEVSDFQQYLQSQGARLADSFAQIPFVYDSIVAFRISSIGEYAKASKKINVVTFDLDSSATILSDRIKKENPPTAGTTTTTTTTLPLNQQPGQSPGSEPNNKNNTKGPPRIVYWDEE